MSPKGIIVPTLQAVVRTRVHVNYAPNRVPGNWMYSRMTAVISTTLKGQVKVNVDIYFFQINRFLETPHRHSPYLWGSNHLPCFQ